MVRAWHFLKAGALALLLTGSAAFAQTAALPAPCPYTVRPGDTLLRLARDYMTSEAAYATVQKLNGVRDPRNIPIGTELQIPCQLLRTEPIIAQITSFRGAVTVDGKPAVMAMKIQQGMRVETGANAFVTIQMPDASAISLPSQSRILVVTLRRTMLTGSLDRNFRLEAGRSRSTVTPMKDPASNFNVTTPLSVSAVRGTDFRVGFDPDAQKATTEVVGGTVGVATAMAMPHIKVPKSFGIVGTSAGLEPVTPLLPAPMLDKVERTANGAAVVAKPVEGATKYRTQLASDVNFQDIFDEAVTDKPVADFTLPANAAFFIRLTAIASSGLEGMPGTYALGRSTPLENNSADAGHPDTSRMAAAGAR